MRSLRKDSENLKDTRIAYTFLLSLAAVCIILGVLTNGLDKRLRENELSDCYRSLSLCSDALYEWEISESEEERYSAAIRFENAVPALPGTVELAPLSRLAAAMKEGAAAPEAIKAYAETFSILGVIDYRDGREARTLIGETLAALGDSAGLSVKDEETVSAELPAEVLAYSRKNAEDGIDAVLGNGSGTLEPKLSGDRSTWDVETENLRMTFSTRDGSLEGFVFLRLGNGSAVGDGTPLPDEDRIAAALELFDGTVRYRGRAEISNVSKMCGFLISEISVSDNVYRAAVDEVGRVWSLIKVKR